MVCSMPASVAPVTPFAYPRVLMLDDNPIPLPDDLNELVSSILLDLGEISYEYLESASG